MIPRPEIPRPKGMNNPKYPLELFLRVITGSVVKMKIVEGLPKLDI